MKFITHKDASSFLVAVLFLEPAHLMLLKVRMSIGFGATKLSEGFDRDRLLSTRDLGAHQHGQSQLPGSVYSEPYPVLEGLSSVKQTRLKQLM